MASEFDAHEGAAPALGVVLALGARALVVDAGRAPHVKHDLVVAVFVNVAQVPRVVERPA